MIHAWYVWYMWYETWYTRYIHDTCDTRVIRVIHAWYMWYVSCISSSRITYFSWPPVSHVSCTYHSVSRMYHEYRLYLLRITLYHVRITMYHNVSCMYHTDLLVSHAHILTRAYMRQYSYLSNDTLVSRRIMLYHVRISCITLPMFVSHCITCITSVSRPYHVVSHVSRPYLTCTSHIHSQGDRTLHWRARCRRQEEEKGHAYPGRPGLPYLPSEVLPATHAHPEHALTLTRTQRLDTWRYNVIRYDT